MSQKSNSYMCLYDIPCTTSKSERMMHTMILSRPISKYVKNRRRWTTMGRKFKVDEDVLGRLMRGRVETHLECRCTVVSEYLEPELVENFVRQANYFSCDILASYPIPGSSLNPNNNASLTWSRQKFRSFPFPKLGAF